MQSFRQLSISTRCELEIEGVCFSDRYTQTLFVRFHLTEELRQLRGAVAQALHCEQEGDFMPHLSLLYKDMPQTEKEELANEIVIPFQSASFAGLTLIAHPAEIRTRADVEAWREISQRG